LLVRPEYCFEGTHLDYFPEEFSRRKRGIKKPTSQVGFLNVAYVGALGIEELPV